ncbi:Gfo/Idh/MocA family protein [Halorussus litoreus]|uniref:Gfo/Idh/MocA family protein n=1 Tax=Halorussus litoreus TaxID=1710536 RepID=UPI000E239CFD|nr:Gfo/Idh/MocA family oxidoreductase [Halorussus litoreus]
MLQFAIIGAGTVAQIRYIPAVDELSNANLRWVVDVDERRAKSVAEESGAGGYATDYEDVLGEVDAAIITTPPRFHEEIAEACIRAGVDVLTEKPVAMSSEDAEALVSLADERGVHYAISRQYRESPACRLLKLFSDNGAVGERERFEIRFGDETNWEFASNYRLDERLSGGGVLTDKGPHALDVVLWILDEPITVESYRDDSFGGLEANAEIELASTASETVVDVELSASRNLTNSVRMVGTRGEITGELGGVTAQLHDFETGDRTVVSPGESNPPTKPYERMAAQVRRFAESVSTGTVSYVPAETGVTVSRLVEECYGSREQLTNSWEATGMEPVSSVF